MICAGQPLTAVSLSVNYKTGARLETVSMLQSVPGQCQCTLIFIDGTQLSSGQLSLS